MTAMVTLHCTLLVMISCGSCLSLESIVYPYGVGAGERSDCNLRYEPEVNLTQNLWFFGKKYQRITIETHEASVELGRPYSRVRINAYSTWPYWYSGPCEGIWFWETADRALLNRGKQDVRKAFKNCRRGFKLEKILVVTWANIESTVNDDWLTCMYEFGHREYCQCMDKGYPEEYCACLHFDHKDFNYCDDYYRALLPRSFDDKEWVYDGYEGKNTIQIVLLYGGNSTYLILNYPKLEWYKKLEDNFAYMELEPFDWTYRRSLKYIHPYSGTADILRLATDSNIGIPGRWMYKVSEKGRFIGPDCRKLHRSD